MDVVEINGLEEYEKIEDDIPIYMKKDPFLDIKIVMVDDLEAVSDTDSDIILTRFEARYYHFFEQNKDKAYNIYAFTETFFNSRLDYDIDVVEKELNQMVSEGKIKGAYYKGR